MKKYIVAGCFALVVLAVACGYFVQNNPDSLLARAEPDHEPIFRYAYSEFGYLAVYYDEDTALVSVVDIIAKPTFKQFGIRYYIRYHIRYDLRENQLVLRDGTTDSWFDDIQYIDAQGMVYGARVLVPYITHGITKASYLKFAICSEKKDYGPVLYEMEQNGYYIFCALHDEPEFAVFPVS